MTIKETRCYGESCGTIMKKHKNCLGQYILHIEDGERRVSVCVGKGLFEMYEIGSKVMVGHIGRKLINIQSAANEMH